MHQHHVCSKDNAVYVVAASCTDIGRVRKQNEDAVVLCEPPDRELQARLGRLYLLADGDGGHAAGEVASRLAVETVAEVYYQRETIDEDTEDGVQENDCALQLGGLSPLRHVLIRALGESKSDVQEPDITTCTVQVGDVMILCCDGLWSLLSEEQIAQVVQTSPPLVAYHELIRLANEAGGNDNISVVLLSFASASGKEV